ncbi:FUSC family protein [Aestuariivivens sediminis]|uniref:FUSC family protein n=1 Tax=Aestuariivivens sediminis TaxID=2913557 RepID=UPI001F586F3A|nr:FUSC family protein [Aestuariivivens sediminis]
MKTVCTGLAIVCSVLTAIFAVLPLSNLAVIPALAALVFGLIAFYWSRKTGEVKKIIPFTFLLTGVALCFTIYKAVFTSTEVAETTALEAKESQLEEEAIEALEDIDLDLEDLEGLEDIDIEE